MIQWRVIIILLCYGIRFHPLRDRHLIRYITTALHFYRRPVAHIHTHARTHARAVDFVHPVIFESYFGRPRITVYAGAAVLSSMT